MFFFIFSSETEFVESFVNHVVALSVAAQTLQEITKSQNLTLLGVIQLLTKLGINYMHQQRILMVE